MAVRRPAALVTGASSGIGFELARLLAAGGYDLVLVARDVGRLDEAAGQISAAHHVECMVIARDLAQPEGPAEVLGEISRRNVEPEVLVNNAGFGVYGFFARTDLAAELDMIRLNVAAVTALAKGVLPGMLRRGSGKILNVASTAAFQPGPLMTVYYATKAYVLSFSEAIANELEGTGVSVTALCPGPTATEFQERAGVSETRLFRGPLVQDAAAVALAGYRGMLRGRRIVIPGVANRLLVQALRVTPRRMATAVARRIQETRR